MSNYDEFDEFEPEDVPWQEQETEEIPPVDYSFENIKSNFPFSSIREGQTKALEEASRYLKEDKIKFVVMQAPTGAGKSPMAVALARAVGAHKAYVLTSNKMLQDQYMRDFDALMKEMKGRSNYQCLSHRNEKTGELEYNCSDSPCRRSKEGRKECNARWGCGYHKAFSEAEHSNVTLMNFAAALCQFNYNQMNPLHKFDTRELLIIDEAHLIEQQLTGFMELSLTIEEVRDNCSSHQIPDDTAPVAAFIEIIENVLKQIDKEMENEDSPNYDTLADRKSRCENVLNEIISDPDNIVVQKNTKPDGSIVLVFRPIDVAPYAKEKLFNHCEKVVMMSATIVNYKAFIQSLGLSEDECVFIDIPSTFPIENRPIVRAYIGTINFKNINELMPIMIDRIKQILNHHKDHKGIIHVSSYKMANDIIMGLGRKLVNERILFPEKSADIQSTIQRHKESERPTVLISPSMAEGLDLKEDLSRFQIICKMPFPSLADKTVQARMKKHPSWLSYVTALKLIQSYGRSIRSETDSAVTYVLDGALEDVLKRNGRHLPKWFTDAIR